jgi:L-rhamnose isomerase
VTTKYTVRTDHFTVERSVDDFTQIEFRYYIYQSVLWLDSYRKSVRKTKRHKFECVEEYNRLSSRTVGQRIADPKLIPGLPSSERLVSEYLAALKIELKSGFWEDRQ